MLRPLEFAQTQFSREEWRILESLNTPKRIQDYLNQLPFNFEKRGQTHRSVQATLSSGEAHCFEGALLAAAAFWIHGERPLLMDLKVVRPDFDHVVTLFKRNNKWGAISKTNHAVLRFREPLYRDLRELAMSYFHEYFLQDGQKTLRSYSKAFDLRKFSPHWLTGSENLAWLAHELDVSPHADLISLPEVRLLRRADKIECQAGEIKEY